MIQALVPQNTAYNLASALRIRGPLDANALSGALNHLRRRHPIFRATVRVVQDQPLQEFASWAEQALTILDYRGKYDEALQRAQAESQTPFDLAHGPMIRVTLMKTLENEHLLTIVLHRFAGDPWSIDVLGREMADFYNRFRGGGGRNSLQPLAINYRDYALWQRDWCSSAQAKRQLSYWRQRLANQPQLDLPVDRPRPPVPSLKGALCHIPIPAALCSDLQRLGGGADGCLFATLLSALAALVHRITGNDDISIAVPAPNRARTSTEALVGTFVNHLVIRLDLSGDPEFRELRHQAQAVLIEALAHQDFPFDQLVQELAQRQDASRPPLAQIMFHAGPSPMRDIAFDGLECEPIPLDTGGSIFDLSVSADTGIAPLISVNYDTAIFDRASIERLMRQYLTILEGATRDATRLSALPLLPPEELLRLQSWNATAASYPRDKIFPQIFEAQAASSPDAIAVSFEGASITYAELNARANQVAHQLRDLGVRPGILVGLCLRRSLDLLIALLAIQKSGGAYVPLDPDFPIARLEYMLSDSSTTVLITADAVANRMNIKDEIITLDLEAQIDAIARQPATNPAAGAGPQDLAYLIYTSGSTGHPKAVGVPHGALLNFLWSMKHSPGLLATDVLAAVTTISFDIAALELYLPLISGARIELTSRETAVDGKALSQQLEASNASVLQATPSMWRMLIEAGWQGRRGFRALCGGEPLPRDLADAILGRVDELWNLYGPTETTVWSTAELVPPGTTAISIGRPIANTQIHILGPLGGIVPIGNIGEIYIGGEGVSAGYHRQAALTAERFIPDHFSARAGARLYRTGDLGRYGADGKLYHLGRLDHQVKIHGFRMELGEIEAILGGHPAVRQAVVVAAEAQPGDRILVAYIVYQNGEDLTASEVRRYLRTQLPDYMVPSIIVTLDSMPLTPTGKLDRNSLPDPLRNALGAITGHDPPSPGMEQAIAEIWQSVLRIDQINATDNFFEIGGHSLLSLRVAQLVESRIGLRMDPRSLFFNNLRQLASLLETKATTGGASG